MNEPKCRNPFLTASHVSISSTAQIGSMSRGNTRISEQCASLFRPINRADGKYVERQYTIFITWCETISMPSMSQIDAL